MAKVYLLGAGPGAVDLITVRGARIRAQANIVLYDALVATEMLELCPQAKCVSVGKRSGQRSTAQQEINQLLVDYARQHEIVVRLKGGDPMIFGRADEEIRSLEQAGLAYEIIPGITTALAAAAAARQPLTKRGVARSVAFFTSSTAPGEAAETRIPNADTIVQYMGGREASLTAERMLASGYAADLPVLAIENCSRSDQRILRLTLQTLAAGLPASHGPVLVMMGPAMAERGTEIKSSRSD